MLAGRGSSSSSRHFQDVPPRPKMMVAHIVLGACGAAVGGCCSCSSDVDGVIIMFRARSSFYYVRSSRCYQPQWQRISSNEKPTTADRDNNPDHHHRRHHQQPSRFFRFFSSLRWLFRRSTSSRSSPRRYYRSRLLQLTTEDPSMMVSVVMMRAVTAGSDAHRNAATTQLG